MHETKVQSTTNVDFDIIATLALVNSNQVLNKIFTKGRDITLINSLASNNSLTKEVKNDLKLLFDTVIIQDKHLITEYSNLYTPKEIKIKPPRRMGKKAVLSKVSELGHKSELHSALLALNDIKNDMARLNRFLISAEVGKKDVSLPDLRQIIALSKSFSKHTKEVIKK